MPFLAQKWQFVEGFMYAGWLFAGRNAQQSVLKLIFVIIIKNRLYYFHSLI